MTVRDVAEFYIRRDALEASGNEMPCEGWDKQLEPGENFSHYDLADSRPGSAAFPKTIVLCQKCTYMVIGYGPVVRKL